MALVDLLATDFMGPKLQSSMKLQIWAYIAVLLGTGGTSLLHPNPALIPVMKNSSRLDNLGSSMLSAKATTVLTL
ncbi:hypothetical protein SADUNF_Sadunf08G0091900 [Salix dunnii]|uniref:Uncharacterized protein n=1 Tax=Salix dunnii TaxID=1413687 RepID=A0A835JY28_9ROSI|nr:hypothetical protein SADUNF_Sadunf08G0091900 [Salix dunnii]